MSWGSEFDEFLKTWKKFIPEDMQDAGVFVEGTLQMAQAIATTIFGVNYFHLHVFDVYDRLLEARSYLKPWTQEAKEIAHGEKPKKGSHNDTV